MLDEANVLLATLAQSAAAVVAIIGGFLVSRLVALSSEREGLRRQRTAARTHLVSVTADCDAAHEVRLANSSKHFEDSVLDCLVDEDFDENELFRNHIPRGSSVEEMRPVLDDVRIRVTAAVVAIRSKLGPKDTSETELSNLKRRGLVIPQGDEGIYQRVMWRFQSHELPSGSYYASGPIVPLADRDLGGIAARRLDESIRDEQNLLGRKVGLEQEIERLTSEMDRIGRPVGVTSAIVILSVFSLLGIAAPLVVMVLHPAQLDPWVEWTLLGAFLLGLFSVLGYIFWYARSLNDPVERPRKESK